ncbi:Rne/Rng family ribonuclease [Rhodoblastus acidophilus]|uniref:Ribonuclease E n=1 Tax=Rhodoblastus acidophilus TaxID=1074 RepID=A0A6N8DIY6_RHOAC|nr:ribonuclease E/G [Rhodoblastus acidophilus]MCW2273442.1 ribonuclease E [Rhodoblastus acidophilus]MTV30472.1 Rne/Rng family ribonuclease [Rhodoblastus acidophilus]
MANKMLIDASHPEETRVVVLRGNRVEEFDFESASKKQLRGNIYLAKVTRVEPSLQAAFVEYGGNRHGFLAFSEIHPDYYQIPHSDRIALLEEESRAHREEDEEESPRRRSRRSRRGAEKRRGGDDRITGEAEESDEVLLAQDGAVEQPADEVLGDSAPLEAAAGEGEPVDSAPEIEAPAESAPVEVAAEAAAFEPAAEPAAQTAEPVEPAPEPAAEAQPVEAAPAEAQPVEEAQAAEGHQHVFRDPEGFAVIEEGHEDSAAETVADEVRDEIRDEDRDVSDVSHDNGDEASDELRAKRPAHDAEEHSDEGDHEEEEVVEQLGGDAMDETPYRAPRLRRQYKIQEVIKRRQVLLIQVVKEERGNKGAALTTYLSLAGRYSVLMPNTARGGGISRKITDASDRKRLKEIAGELEVPEGMGVILRTAGAARTKQEIQRDFEYLMRMWEQVRELTLTSSAPALVYEEGSLIKRAIRDLYNKEIDEVMVAGDTGYREARDFMRLLMPSHVKNVVAYRDPQPIFAKWGAESQLDALFHNQVTLRSGGYIVINQTEALVAIDVNSGRSTREHNIEDTALRTNLEAADEVARQLRLRDLAGLIVVDFIDMEESRNNRAVERRLKEALKDDRARIQVGRISHFGLLEMSRQRIRTGVLEGSSVICPHCAGAGTVRSTSSVAVHVMRVLEDALIKSATHNVILRTRTDIALYILNQKRALLRLIEERFGVSVTVEADDSLAGGAWHALERGEPADPLRRFDPRRPLEDPEPIGEAETEAEFDEEQVETTEAEGAEGEDRDEADGRRRRRRRRGRGRGFERESSNIEAGAPQPSDEGLSMMAAIGGDLMAPAERAESPAEGEDEGARDENGRRGRGRWRRRGRGRGGEFSDFNGDWRPSAGEAGEASGEGSGEESGEGEGPGEVASEPIAAPFEAGPVEAVVESAPSVESAPHFESAPSFENAPVVAEAPQAAANDDAPAAVVESAPDVPELEAAPVEPAPKADRAPLPVQPELPVITEADPSAPKRSGWWSRAKASLTGK